MPPFRILAVAAALGLSPFVLIESAQAQTVTLAGSMGSKAVLIIDGAAATLAVGETRQGVRLVSVNGSVATVQVDGRSTTLLLGATQVSLGGEAGGGGNSQLVLTAGAGGHFTTGGSINGKPVEFMVDTGATVVSLSQAEADRIGLNYRSGRRGVANTANGQVPVHLATLSSIRIGDVQVYNVEAVVMPAQMDKVLLGNSFLSRFQLKLENDRMTLDKRP